jgi:hypothetical protein
MDEEKEGYKLENIVDRPLIVYYIDGGGLYSCMKIPRDGKIKVHFLQCFSEYV